MTLITLRSERVKRTGRMCFLNLGVKVLTMIGSLKDVLLLSYNTSLIFSYIFLHRYVLERC